MHNDSSEKTGMVRLTVLTVVTTLMTYDEKPITLTNNYNHSLSGLAIINQNNNATLLTL